MGRYELDPTRDHSEQAAGLLATALSNGYGVPDVTWDPATGTYEAPDEVVAEWISIQKANAETAQAEAEDEPDDATDTDEAAEEAPVAKRRAGRRKAAETEGDGSDPDAGKE